MKMNRPRYIELTVMLAGRRATTERERWDQLWTHECGQQWLAHCYAEGLTDTHIDTALRKWLGRE